MPTFKFDKLVRDKIPEIMEADGVSVSSHIADGQEMYDRLLAKMREEYKEFQELPSVEEACDFWEASDAFERKYGISNDWQEANGMFDSLGEALRVHGFGVDDIELAQDMKRERVGGFMGMIVIDTVAVRADDAKNIERFTQKGYPIIG